MDNIDKIVEMASDCHGYSDDAGKKRIDISPDQLKELLRAFLEPCKLEYNVYDKEDWLSETCKKSLLVERGDRDEESV